MSAAGSKKRTSRCTRSRGLDSDIQFFQDAIAERDATIKKLRTEKNATIKKLRAENQEMWARAKKYECCEHIDPRKQTITFLCDNAMCMQCSSMEPVFPGMNYNDENDYYSVWFCPSCQPDRVDDTVCSSDEQCGVEMKILCDVCIQARGKDSESEEEEEDDEDSESEEEEEDEEAAEKHRAYFESTVIFETGPMSATQRKFAMFNR